MSKATVGNDYGYDVLQSWHKAAVALTTDAKPTRHDMVEYIRATTVAAQSWHLNDHAALSVALEIANSGADVSNKKSEVTRDRYIERTLLKAKGKYADLLHTLTAEVATAAEHQGILKEEHSHIEKLRLVGKINHTIKERRAQL